MLSSDLSCSSDSPSYLFEMLVLEVCTNFHGEPLTVLVVLGFG